MSVRAGILASETSGVVQFSGGGTQHIVQTPAGVFYLICIDIALDVMFIKSTDNGLTWTSPTIVAAKTMTALSVWYDRWSNIAAGLIHVAYTDSAADDTFYRTIDTESSDALSTETVIFAGTSTANGGQLSITRARGGNVYCRTCIDNGSEGGFFRLPNANVPSGAWDAALTINEALAASDQVILVPGWAADNQDIMAFFWDASANEISRQLYDDSGDSWGETSIATSMVDLGPANSFPHYAAAVDIANSRNLLVAWSAIDTLNADLRCWYITESAITEVTNVVQDSTDDQGLCGLCIDTISGIWWVFYGGKTDGSETFPTAINLYCKGSTDSGVTWGPETKLTIQEYALQWLTTVQRLLFPCPLPPPVVFHNNVTKDEIKISISTLNPRTSMNIGI